MSATLAFVRGRSPVPAKLWGGPQGAPLGTGHPAPAGLFLAPSLGWRCAASDSVGYGVRVCRRKLPNQLDAGIGRLAEKARCKFNGAIAA
eukprot:3407347-Pyramimonas_sp.AAC.1